MKKFKLLFIALITLCFSINSVKAEETNVARIGEKEFATLDEAITEAKEDDIIELLSDAETIGINLSKNLTIKSASEEKHTITFTKYGIALWSKNLTFENVEVVMNDIGSTPYTAEWNWMTICASKDSELILKNTTMIMDNKNDKTEHINKKGEITEGQHAIYFTGNDKLNLTNSTLIIKNYTQDALEWDGGDGGYNINLDNSSYISDSNRSGFTGTFVVKAENSNIDVINSTGNGSNGSHFEFINSFVNFNNNNAHGLSAGNLTINNSTVTSDGNGANGVHVNGEFKVNNNSTLTITHNDCSISSKWTIPGALYVGGNGIVDKTTKLTITNNNGSGIYVKAGANLDLQTGIITQNIAVKLGLGGGINNNGTLNISEGVEINNNKAEIAGDDIYSTSFITVPKVIEEKNLIEKREDNEVLNDCAHEINGWYDDGNKNEDEKNSRWEAHGVTEEEDHIILVEPNEYQGFLSIKAAHDKIKGNVIVNYVDSDGNKLTDEIIYTDVVDSEYTTEKKEFDGYTNITVEGQTTGKYIDGTIYVTYYYDKNTGTGDILPPQTGFEPNTLNNTNVENIAIYKKEEE